MSKIAIFECIALNTSPIGKKGSIFEGAVPGKGMLADMASYVQSGNFVKMHTLHAQGDQLPIGNIFMAELKGEELRALFYIGRETQAGQDLIAALNNGTIDEVSVGVKSAALRCSECGWDFFGPDATLMNLFDRTCANDHVIGTDGVHVNMDGLDRWMETSLVSLGAAKGAKIVGRTRSLLGADEYQRLAASGFDPDITTLFAVGGKVSVHKTEEEATMADQNAAPSEAGFALVASLTTEKVTAQLALTAAQTQIAELTATGTAQAEKIAELTAQVADAAASVALKADHDKVIAFMSELTRSSMVASGVATPVVPTTVDAMLAALDEAKAKLGRLPVGGVAEAAADTDEKSAVLSVSTDAFKTRK